MYEKEVPKPAHWRPVLSGALLLVLLLACLIVGAAAEDCANDNDGDGYYTDCAPYDCNDSDPGIYPGATEICNEVDNDCDGVSDFEQLHLGRESEASPADSCGDGVDNDGDGQIDLDDQQCKDGFCQTTNLPGNPPGCTYPPSAGFCVVGGSFNACAPDGTVMCPEPGSGWPTVQPELVYTAECHDGLDNDWDGLTDGDDPDCQGPETCNGLDDDYDGTVDNEFDVGTTCSNGLLGLCSASGQYVCNAAGDDVDCTAPSLAAQEEGPFGDSTCDDEVDNDCDGLTDFPDDPNCTTSEICDYLDNDGDGSIDEDFDGLGVACSAGVGACSAEGIQVCSGDLAGTVCNAVPKVAGTEGPTGPTCSDGLDNDCDGQIDGEDPSCSSAGLTVSCALPYRLGQPGADCTGWHIIQYETNAGQGATVLAELVALDAEGNVIESKPVQAGNWAHLASRVDPEDYKFEVFTVGKKTLPSATRFQLFAPIPLLRVTVQDGLNKAQAFCSNVPYVQVLEPDGNVVSTSEGDVTRIFAALPLVDIDTLLIKVDGVDLLAALSKAADECTPTTPCSGNVTINGKTVTVTDLKIQVAPIADLSSNTLSMSLSGLGCGGHVVVVQADQGIPGWIRRPPTPACHMDDLRSKGTSSGLTVDITSPTPLEVVATFPIHVTGKACSGRPLAGVQINSQRLDLSTGVDYIPGDGEDSGDLYSFDIELYMPESDLGAGLAGTPQVGTFDRGSNRLSAEVIDDLGNRSFDTFFFAAGQVAEPGTGPLAVQAGPPALDTELVNDAIQDALQEMTKPAVASALATTSVEVENAFVVGLTPEAAQKVFEQRCKEASQKIVDKIRANILAVQPVYKKVSGGCSCDPTVKIWISDVQADPDDISCPLEFVDDQIKITANLPDVVVYGRAYGRCKTTFLGACVAETIVDISSNTTISDIQLEFTVTEDQMMGQPGEEPLYVEGTSTVHTTGGSEVNCLAAACNWAIEGLVTIFTFGTVDLDLSPQIDISSETDINAEIGATEKDPMKVDEIKVDEEQVQEYGQVLRGDLEDVQITPNGLRATLTGQFSTLSPDGEVEDTPGASLSPADPPVIHPEDALELYLALADDTFNQLFASMTASGKLKTKCTETTLTFGDLLPADCETISIPDKPGLTDALQGTCHGFKNATCSDITGNLVEKAACGLAKNKLASLNITTSTPLLLCVKQDNPPEFLIKDETGTDPVETALHLNGLSVAFVLDRNNNGFDGLQLADTPKCLAAGAPTTGDCWAYAMCLNLDLLTEMQFGACEDGKPGLITSFKSINIPTGGKQVGMVCGGTAPPEDDLLNQSASNSEPVTIDLTDNVDEFTPPMCAEGLDLGGYVGGLDATSLKVIAIDAGSGKSDPFQDYLGITGDVVEK